MNAHLTDQDCADLPRILRDVIAADSYLFSPKVRCWTDLLPKLDPRPERALRYAPPRSPSERSRLRSVVGATTA